MGWVEPIKGLNVGSVKVVPGVQAYGGIPGSVLVYPPGTTLQFQGSGKKNPPRVVDVAY